jgi:hypothetical protein
MPESREPSATTPVAHTIHEDVVLDDPARAKTRFEIVGDVFWEIHGSPVLARNEVDAILRFEGQATMAHVKDTAGYSIAGKDHRRVDLTDHDAVEFDEIYPVTGTPEPMSLLIRFVVTEREIRVKELRLISAAVDRG